MSMSPVFAFPLKSISVSILCLYTVAHLTVLSLNDLWNLKKFQKVIKSLGPLMSHPSLSMTMPLVKRELNLLVQFEV